MDVEADAVRVDAVGVEVLGLQRPARQQLDELVEEPVLPPAVATHAVDGCPILSGDRLDTREVIMLEDGWAKLKDGWA